MEGFDKWFAAKPEFADGNGNNRVVQELKDRTVHWAVPASDDGAVALATTALLTISAFLMF